MQCTGQEELGDSLPELAGALGTKGSSSVRTPVLSQRFLICEMC